MSDSTEKTQDADTAPDRKRSINITVDGTTIGQVIGTAMKRLISTSEASPTTGTSRWVKVALPDVGDLRSKGALVK